MIELRISEKKFSKSFEKLRLKKAEKWVLEVVNALPDPVLEASYPLYGCLVVEFAVELFTFSK